MAHFPKPFFKKARSAWYVQLDGKQIKLATEKDVAFERYHQLMQERPKNADFMMVVGVLDAFLDWLKKNKAERTYEWYHRHLQTFAKAIPASLAVIQLKRFHVTKVLDQHTDWSSTNKNGLCRAVQRAFRWAEDEELIVRSPIGRLQKPRCKRREVVIPPDIFDVILGCFPAREIRDLLIAAWETGARPQELVAVEARHVDLAMNRWRFPAEESKGKQFERVIYLTEQVADITRRLMLKHPEGPLFRNCDGRQWNRYSVSNIFARLRIRLGLQKMRELGQEPKPLDPFSTKAMTDPKAIWRARRDREKHLYERRKDTCREARKLGPQYCLYHFRHSWCTRALRHCDPLTVALLMGHSDPSMLAKVYQHLAHDPRFMQEAARKATGTNA